MIKTIVFMGPRRRDSGPAKIDEQDDSTYLIEVMSPGLDFRRSNFLSIYYVVKK